MRLSEEQRICRYCKREIGAPNSSLLEDNYKRHIEKHVMESGPGLIRRLIGWAWVIGVVPLLFDPNVYAWTLSLVNRPEVSVTLVAIISICAVLVRRFPRYKPLYLNALGSIALFLISTINKGLAGLVLLMLPFYQYAFADILLGALVGLILGFLYVGKQLNPSRLISGK